MSGLYFAGVEGGATGSTLIIFNENGEKLSTIKGESTNLWLIGIPEVVKRISKMAREAQIKAQIPEITFKAIGLSLSGCEQEETNEILKKELMKFDPKLSENYVVCSDTLGSILTTSNLGGLVAISGTGSNVCLRNPNGELLNCGGWGHMLGDEGSGYWIAWRAVKIVFDDMDNFEKSPHNITPIWNTIKSHFNVKDRTDMLEHCYTKFDKSFYAQLCLKLSKIARNGDKICLDIFREAGKCLAKSVAALLIHVDPLLIHNGYLNIVCAGSVWLSFDLLKNGFLFEINGHQLDFGLKLIRLKDSLGLGACYLAADSIKFDLPRDYQKNYEVFFTIHKNGRLK